MRTVSRGMTSKDYFGFELPLSARFVAFRRGTKSRAAHRYADGGALPFNRLFVDYPASQYHYALYLPSTDFVVVDVDVKSHPESQARLRQWFNSFGLTGLKTIRVRTPSGGLHVYFRIPEGFPRGRWINALAHLGIPGVDILADGIVFLPKAQIGDRFYTLIEGGDLTPDSVSVLPQPFIDAIAQSMAFRNGYDESRLPTARDEYLAHHRLLDPSLVLAFLKSLGSRVYARGNRMQATCPYHDDRNPSLSILVREDKLLVHCFSCDSSGQSTTYGRFVEDYIRWATESRRDQELPSRRLPTLVEIREAVRSRPKRQGVWGPLFQQGTLTMLGGYQRDFKSTLMKNVMAAVSKGRMLNGLPTKQGVSLLIAYEEPLDYLTSRFDHLDLDPSQIVVVSREPVGEDSPTIADLEEDPLRVLEQWIEDYRPTLVVLDTAWNFVSAWKTAFNRLQRSTTRFSPTPTNEEIHYLFSQIKSIAERYDTAIVFIWHRRKGDDTGKDALSGVRALSASADSAVLMHRVEEHSSVVKLIAEGRHPTLVWELEFDEATGVLKESNKSDEAGHHSASSAEPESSFSAPPVPKPWESEDLGHPSQQVPPPMPSFTSANPPAPSFTNGGLYQGQPSEAYEAMPKLQPMGWYAFQTRANRASVIRLNLPAERKGDSAPYYVALAPSRDWRVRGVYGCTIQWAIEGKSCYSGMTPESVPRLVFDIECESVDPERSRVIGIGIRYARSADETPIAETKVLSPDERTDEHERELIEWFDAKLKSIDPWWLGGYNIFGFDIPFLLIRAQKLGTQLSWLNEHFYRRHIKFRYGSSEKDVDAWFARHDPKRACIDAYLLALRMDVASGGQLPNQKLYTVYEYLFGEKVEFENKSEMAVWNPEMVEFLLETDVACADLVLMRLISVEFALSEYVPLPFSELIYSGQGVRAETVLIADYLRRRRAIRCEPIQAPEEGFRGAISEAVRTGIFEPIAKIDVVSLYPSIIIDEGLAPRNDYDGRLPILLRRMRDVRVQYKKQSDAISQLRQQALKILINSAYGFMGAEGFLFSDPEKSARVAERGRETILLMQSILESTGNVPLELDTDGILFVPSGDWERAVEELKSRTPFDYEVEHYAKGMILAAKSYVLVDKSGRYVVKGASLRSRREPRVAQNLLRQIVDSLLNRRSLEPVLKSYFDAVEQATNPEDLVRVQLYTGKTKMTDGSTPRKGDTVYNWWSKSDSRLQTTSRLPSLEEIDRSALKAYAAQLIGRFDAIPEVKEFLARYGGQKQFVRQFVGGQVYLDFELGEEEPP